MNKRTLLLGLIAVALIAAGGSVLLLSPRTRDGSQAPPRVIIDTVATATTGATPTQTPEPAVAITRLQIPSIKVDAPMVVLGVAPDGTMQSPSKPMDVGWYTFSGTPGQQRNIVMAGHVDYVNFGPAVFARLRDLTAGEEVLVETERGRYAYRVTSVTAYDEATAPVAEIVGRTDGEVLTLITCTGVFDTRVREYNQRLVVRADRVIS